MIKKLIIKGTEDTPEVVLDRENAKFEISGRSLPENVNIFFEPVFKWITEYFNDPLKETVFSINLEYYNSSTAKKIVELLFIIESHFDKGCLIKLIWLYKRNDFTMQRKGEDLLGIFKIPNEIIPY
jgi:hypothetical protein